MEKIDGRICYGSLLEKVPFLFLLYLIYINRITGIGVVKTDGISKNLVFSKGLLVSAATTRKEERLGNFVLRRRNGNVVTPETLEQLAKEARKQGKRLGSYLVERRLLSPKALQELLALQVEEILSDTFFWKKGRFYFLEKSISGEELVNYAPLKIALIAAQRRFRFTRFRKETPDNKIVFRPSPYAEKEKEEIMERLNANEQFILSLTDGTRNIDQLIKFSGADEVSVLNILYRLSVMGLVRRTKEVGEYEDKEFMEMSQILKMLFEVFNVITSELFYELGLQGKEMITKSAEGFGS